MTEQLTPGDLIASFRAAADHLAASAPAIDAINVYPVPDGDTGSNMAATFRAAVDAMEPGMSIQEAMAAASRGALYGARGNSGVILSQALRGLGEFPTDDRLDAASAAAALRRAADAAYAAITNPQEGTMLTVLRAAADGAHGDNCLDLLRNALESAEKAEANTINQLAKLTEAGVTDAGGEGICTILRGIVYSLAGEDLPAVNVAGAPLARLVDHGEEFGFCSEFLLTPFDGAEVDMSRLRDVAEGGGNRSVIVVGDRSLARVHAHTDDPDALLAAARRLGNTEAEKVENMTSQNVEMRAKQPDQAALGMLVLCDGDGLAEAFEGLGATVLRQQDEHRPSVRQVAGALEAAAGETLLLLPNHRDLVPVAEQAAGLVEKEVRVVRTVTVPQGLAAALAYDPDGELEDIAGEMEEAGRSVSTLEVTTATESRSADGVTIQRGDVIAIVDGKIVAAEADISAAVLTGLRRIEPGDGSLASMYTGLEVDADVIKSIREAIEGEFAGCEVEVQDGGQRLYPLIISVE